MIGAIDASVAAAFVALFGVLAAQVVTVWLNQRSQVADSISKTREDAFERIATTRWADAASACAAQEVGVSRISGAIEVARQIEALSQREDSIPAKALKPPSITEETRQVGGQPGTAAMIRLWHQWHVYSGSPTLENRQRLDDPGSRPHHRALRIDCWRPGRTPPATTRSLTSSPTRKMT